MKVISYTRVSNVKIQRNDILMNGKSNWENLRFFKISKYQVQNGTGIPGIKSRQAVLQPDDSQSPRAEHLYTYALKRAEKFLYLCAVVAIQRLQKNLSHFDDGRVQIWCKKILRHAYNQIHHAVTQPLLSTHQGLLQMELNNIYRVLNFTHEFGYKWSHDAVTQPLFLTHQNLFTDGTIKH